MRAPFFVPDSPVCKPARDSNTGRTCLCSTPDNFDEFFSRSDKLTVPFCTQYRSKDSALDLVSDFDDVKHRTRVIPNWLKTARPLEVVRVEGVGKNDARFARIAITSGSPAALFDKESRIELFDKEGRIVSFIIIGTVVHAQIDALTLYSDSSDAETNPAINGSIAFGFTPPPSTSAIFVPLSRASNAASRTTFLLSLIPA